MKHLTATKSENYPDQYAVLVSEFRESDSYAVLFFKAGKLLLKSGGYLTREEAHAQAVCVLEKEWPTFPVKPITLELIVDNVFAADVLTTALQGGIDYWACAEHLQADDEGNTVIAYLTDSTGENYEDLPKYVDLDVIRLGIKRALKVGSCRQDIRETILTAVASDDVGQIDAEAADVIVQLGLFDDVVFG